MRNLVLVLIVLALALYWLGSPPASEEVLQGRLRMALDTDPRTLDPAQSTSTHSGIVLGLMHACLMRFDLKGLPEYDAAKFFKLSEDGLTYTFTLNEDLRFSDGSPLKARDVVFSLNRLADPRQKSPRASLLDAVEGFEAFQKGKASSLSGVVELDERTVKIRLVRPFGPFLAALAMPQTSILKAEHLENGGDLMKVPSSGPFRLVEWERDQHLLLTENPWHRRSGNVREVYLRILKDPLTVASHLRSGQIDLAEVKPQIADTLKAQGFRLAMVEEYNLYFLGLNMKGWPGQHEKLRRAIHLGVDRKTILEGFLKGQGRVATGPVPHGLRGYLRSDFPEFDPVAARKIVEENGYGSRPLKLALFNHPDNLAMGQIFVEQLKAVGLKVELVPRDWNGFTQALLDGEYDLFYRNWVADYPDGDNFLYPLYHSSSTGLMGNYPQFASLEFDSVIEESRRETDPLKREKLLREAARIARDGMSRLCLWSKRKILAVSSRLRSFEPRPMYNSNKFLDAQLAN